MSLLYILHLKLSSQFLRPYLTTKRFHFNEDNRVEYNVINNQWIFFHNPPLNSTSIL